MSVMRYNEIKKDLRTGFMGDTEKMDLHDYRQCFDRLQAIAYRHISVNGVSIRVLGVHFMDNGPEWKVFKHRHSFFEFHYVTDHYTYTTINDSEQKITAGSFYLMPPGTYHSHRQDPGCGHTGFSLRWEYGLDGKKDEKQENSGYELSRIQDALLTAHSQPVADEAGIADSMLGLLKMAGAGVGVLQLQLEFCQLLNNIAGCYSTGAKAYPAAINYNFLENQIVNNAIKFVEENYSQEIDAGNISSSVHLSYSHLARLFKKHTGDTVNHHLSRIRLGKAQRLLMCSDKGIAQIAREVGYNNDHYFCTAFKKLYGVTPGNYRHGCGPLSE